VTRDRSTATTATTATPANALPTTARSAPRATPGAHARALAEAPPDSTICLDSTILLDSTISTSQLALTRRFN